MIVTSDSQRSDTSCFCDKQQSTKQKDFSKIRDQEVCVSVNKKQKQKEEKE